MEKSSVESNIWTLHWNASRFHWDSHQTLPPNEDTPATNTHGNTVAQRATQGPTGGKPSFYVIKTKKIGNQSLFIYRVKLQISSRLVDLTFLDRVLSNENRD